MAKRHRDALAIAAGASNPLAVSNAISDACREIDDERGSIKDDPAVILMVHQLAHIVGEGYIMDLLRYHHATTECEKRSV